jgi:DNA-binding transcriptional LysR family regulator
LKLFDRKQNRLSPTEVAEAFYAEVFRVYHGVEHLERFVTGLENDFRGQIDFGVLPMAAYEWIPSVVAKFLESHHTQAISLPVRSSRQILEWVAADRLDFGIVLAAQQYTRVKIETLLSIPIVCVFPKESGLGEKARIDWNDLKNKTIIRLKTFDTWTVGLEKAFEIRTQAKNIVETYVTQTAVQIAKESRGCAIVDLMSAKEIIDDTMDWRPFESDTTFLIHLAYSASRKRSPDADAMMDHIRESAMVEQERLQQDIAIFEVGAAPAQ